MFSFSQLLDSRTDSYSIIVWDVVNPVFWIHFSISLLSLIYLLHQSDLSDLIKTFLTTAFSFTLFGALAIVYKYMWGFDTWLHLGFLKKAFILGGLGSKPFSPLEYIGYRSLLVSIAEISAFSMNDIYWLHLLISPTLASIFIPSLIFLILRLLYDTDKVWIGAISFVFFPLSMMMAIALPNWLAIIYFLITLYFALDFLIRRNKIDLFHCLLVALTNFSFHQQYGAPALMVLILLIPFLVKRTDLTIKFGMRTYSVRNFSRVLSLGFCLVLSIFLIPALLFLRPLAYMELYNIALKSPKLVIPSINSIFEFLIATNSNSNVVYEIPLYVYWDSFKLIRLIIIAIGGFLLLRKTKTVGLFYIFSIISIYCSWFVLENAMIITPFARVGHRLGMHFDMLIAPLLGVIIYEGWSRFSRNNSVSLSLMVISMVILSSMSIYVGFDYDRLLNRPDPFRERVITDNYISALKWIQSSAGDHDYVIVSDYYFGKLAAGYLGLRPYYPLDMKFIHLNIGNKLGTYFFKIAKDPQKFKEILSRAMKETHSSIAFYVIDSYWIKHRKLSTYENIKIICQLANACETFSGNNQKIYVAKLLTDPN